MIRLPPRSTLSLHDALPIFGYLLRQYIRRENLTEMLADAREEFREDAERLSDPQARLILMEDRKSTRLNSSHTVISYAVFCLKKKKTMKYITQVRTYVKP